MTKHKRLIYHQEKPLSRARILIEETIGSKVTTIYVAQANATHVRDIVNTYNRTKILEKTFRHYFKCNPEEQDTCKACGLDLRDPIHHRANTKEIS